MTQIIIPETSIERIYPSEEDVGNNAYNGVRGTEQNIAKGCQPVRNGIISNRDGAGVSLGEGGFNMQTPTPGSLTVTFNLGVAYINGYYINCVVANTVNLVLDASKVLYIYLKLVKAGGIVNNGGDPDGALKIVSSETPTAINDYVPLYRVETDATEVISLIDIRPRALGIPTPILLSVSGGPVPADIGDTVTSAILPTGFDEYNVLSGVMFANNSVAGAVRILADNGVDAPIVSEFSVGPPEVPAVLGDNLFQVRLKIPTSYKPDDHGLYRIGVTNQPSNISAHLTTNVKAVVDQGVTYVPEDDYRATWFLADW